MAYPAMMRFLATGFLGLVVAGTLAAYRSTIETHLNWGTWYLVHDFYRRFLRPGRAERHYERVERDRSDGRVARRGDRDLHRAHAAIRNVAGRVRRQCVWGRAPVGRLLSRAERPPHKRKVLTGDPDD